MGYFYEFYGEIKDELKSILHLKRLKPNKRRAAYGFPMTHESAFAKKLIEKGIPVVVIKETDRYIGRIKERLPITKLTKK